VPYIKALLWRIIYAVIIVVVIVFAVPLLFALVGLAIPGGPAIELLKFAFAALILLYVFFGPPPPTPF
jgi:hypothetical protein